MRGGRGPQAADPNAELSAGEKVGESIGLGAAKAGIEIKDFIFGEPDFQDRWASRKYIETRSKQLRGESVRIPTKSPGCTDMKSPGDSETMSPTSPI